METSDYGVEKKSRSYNQARRHWGGDFGWLIPSNWNMKHYKSVEFFSKLNVKPHCTNVKPPRTNVKPPYWRLSGNGSGYDAAWCPFFYNVKTIRLSMDETHAWLVQSIDFLCLLTRWNDHIFSIFKPETTWVNVNQTGCETEKQNYIGLHNKNKLICQGRPYSMTSTTTKIPVLMRTFGHN